MGRGRKVAGLVASVALVGSLAAWGSAGAAAASTHNSSASRSSSGQGAKATTLHVGYIDPLTGAFASIGESSEQGWKTGMQVFGTKVDGVRIETTFVDDAGTSTRALSDAQRLVHADHVKLVEGPILANVDEAVANYLGPTDVPLVDLCECSAIQEQTYKKYNDAFASSSTADQTATYAARYMRDVLHYSHITVYGMDYAFGWEAIGSFTAEFKALGGRIDKAVWVPVATTDQAPFVAQIPQTTQAVAILLVGALAPSFFHAYSGLAQGKAPVFGITGISTDQALLPAEPATTVKGVLSASWYCDGATSAANKQFVTAFEHRYHAVPGYYAEAGYEKAHMLVAAVKALKGKVPSGRALLHAVEKAAGSITEPRGHEAVSSRTDSPTQDISICKVANVGGTLRNVTVKTYHGAPPWGLLPYKSWWSLFQHDSTARPTGL